MRDLANSIAVRRLISPAAAVANNAAIVSQVLDRSGFEKVVVAIAAGALAAPAATFTTLLEHGDTPNLADAAPVPDDNLTGTEADASFTGAEDHAVKKLGYVGAKRYLRLTVTPSGNNADAFFSAIAILSGSRHFPAV